MLQSIVPTRLLGLESRSSPIRRETGAGPLRGGSVDERLQAVVANWSARFVANDIDPLDVERTLADVTSWDDWADAWEATASHYAELADAAAEAGHRTTAAQHRRRASLILQFGQFVLNDDPGRRRALHARQCELFRLAAPDLVPPALPYSLDVGPGRAGHVRVHGYVRRPDHLPAHGVVLLIPGLESTKEQFSTFEPYLLERGIATVSIEGPGQGEAHADHPFRLREFLTAYAAVRHHVDSDAELRALPVALLGTSFGGFLALRCAVAEDVTPDVAAPDAVVAIAGPHTLTPLAELQPILQEGFVHLSGARDVTEADELLADVTLSGHLDRLSAPTLLVHGDADRIIPVAHADRIAAEAGERGDRFVFDRIAGGSHSCNNFHTTVRPRIADWLSDRLHEARA
jgi:alpha-beta hydrolase superfamily lysophospholipase